MHDYELEDVEVLLKDGGLLELAVRSAYFDIGCEELAQVGDLLGVRLLDRRDDLEVLRGACP
ncbi:hypothetical protein [Streptomyces sp. NPDC055036]